MVEDLARNLAPAAAMGMTTVWVRAPLPGGTPDAGNDAQVADHVIDDLSGWLGELTAAASY